MSNIEPALTIPKPKCIPTDTLKENDVHIWVTVTQRIPNIDLLYSYRDLLSCDVIVRVDR